MLSIFACFSVTLPGEPYLRDVEQHRQQEGEEAVFRLDQQIKDGVEDDRGDEEGAGAAVEQFSALADDADSHAYTGGAGAVHQRRSDAPVPEFRPDSQRHQAGGFFLMVKLY